MIRQQRPAGFGVTASTLLVACLLAGGCSSPDDPADTSDATSNADAAPDTADATVAADGQQGDVSVDAGTDSTASDGAGDDATADGSTDAAASNQCSADKDCDGFAGPCVKVRCGSAGFCVVEQIADGTACDDGAPCTVLDRCDGGSCKGTPGGCDCKSDADCKALDDDLCDGTLTCMSGGADGSLCVPAPDSAVTCTASPDPCAPSACAPKTGACVATPSDNGAPCDDGDACTVDTTCQAGSCVGLGICPCTVDADCKDDDLCDGTSVCDSKTNTCVLDKGSVVVCPSVDDTACNKNTCDPKTGACAMQPASGGTGCDDGDPCTDGDFCDGTSCKSGQSICGCTVDADCASKEDGNLCNGTLYCDLLAAPPVCKVHPLTLVSCGASDGGACSSQVCQPKTGACAAVAAPLGTPCDDGNACSKDDTCKDGACKPGLDNCPCKIDSDCAAHDPNNPCVGSLYCDTSLSEPSCKINPATVPFCDPADDTACLANRCEPKTGGCVMAPRAEGASCDADGSPCTLGDVCKAGKCVAGPNVCSCEADADCAAKDDANVCNGTLYCNKSATPYRCEINPKTVVTCPTAVGACKAAVCDAGTGLCGVQNVADDTGCDADGNPCTVGDVCTGGVCTPGPAACGCITDADCAAKDDGNLCNGTSYCDKSAAPFVCKEKPDSAVVCGTANDTACSKNTCAKATGACSMQPVDENTPCDDGQNCTVSDRCKSGVCTGGPSVCACENDAACAALDDGNPCNGTLFCDKSALPYACRIAPSSVITCPSLDLPCASMQCDPKSATCIAQPKGAQGGSCDDDDACTVNTTCQGTACTNGKPISCEDANPCTLDQCIASSGCAHVPITGPACFAGEVSGFCVQGDCKAVN
ncbi:MAG: hypothetical protein H6747_16060 [Deltaproteobacteria bacterium]|nr:hypothetical protein [Deltaproteobacteria bacterium]